MDPNYQVSLYDAFEVEFHNQLELTIGDEARIVFGKWKSDFNVAFNANAFLSTEGSMKMKICGTTKDVKLSAQFWNELEQNAMAVQKCEKDEEFSLLVQPAESNGTCLFSLQNVSMIVSKSGLEIPIPIKDRNNFILKIDGQQVDFAKQFLNGRFPLFTDKISEFYYVDHFKEITVFEHDYTELLDGEDYCFSFWYFNIDNSVSLRMVAGTLNYELNLIDLPTTYYEEAHSTYQWFKVKELCFTKFYVKPDSFPDKVQFKLLQSSQRDAVGDLFAVGRFYTSKSIRQSPGLRTYLGSWNQSYGLAMDQWNVYPLSSHYNIVPNYAVNLSANYQSRPLNFYAISDLIKYEPKSSLTFDIYCEFKEVKVKVQWLDQLDKLLKENVTIFSETTNEMRNQPTNGTINETIGGSQRIRSTQIDFTELDAQNFNNTFNQLYRLFITITLPAYKQINADLSNKVKSFYLTNLQYSDPCVDNRCVNDGKCLALSNHRYRCECLPQNAGEFCEFPNRCRQAIDDNNSTTTGDAYCAQFDVKCKSLDNDFECECDGDKYWDKELNLCVSLGECAFKVCGLHEYCVIEDGKAQCICTKGYTFILGQDRCVLDPCSNPNICTSSQDCLNIAGLKEPICACKPGFYNYTNACRQIEPDNPFVRQQIGCEHTYEYGESNRLICKCFEGYVSKNNSLECVKIDGFGGQADLEQCSKCNSRQLCIKTGDQVTCACKLGFSGESCEQTYCEAGNKEELEGICGELGCNLNETTTSEPRFECNCDKRYTELDPKTGRCELIDICKTQTNKCGSSNVNCWPMLTTDNDQEVLTSFCGCGIGGTADAKGDCQDSCDLYCATPLMHECETDLLEDTHLCTCDKGYIQQGNRCVISSDSVTMTVNMVLRSTKEMTERSLPENKIIGICKFVADKRNCLLKYDADYRRVYFNLTKEKIDRFIRTSLKKQLIRGLSGVIYQRPFNLWVTSFTNLTYLDYEQFGFKTNYSVEVFIASKFNSDVKVSLLQQTSPERIKSKCFPKTYDQLANQGRIRREVRPKGSKKNRMMTSLKRYRQSTNSPTFCLLTPDLILYNMVIIDPIRVNLCNLPGTVLCPFYTHCKVTEISQRKGTSFDYYCSCNAGFVERSLQMSENEIPVPLSCDDIDECTSPSFKDCDLSTTTCENLIGNYSCNCHKGYKRFNRTSCEGN